MSRKCEKLHLRFCWKAALPRNKLKLCFPIISCPCELTLEPFVKNLSTARPKQFSQSLNWNLELKIFRAKRLEDKKCRLTNKETNKYTGIVALWENKKFYQKSHLNAQHCLSRQFHVQPAIMYFFSFLEINPFSSKKLRISIWK